MNSSSSILTGLMLKSAPLCLGAFGVGVGSWQCYESGGPEKPAPIPIKNKERTKIDSSVLNSTTETPERKKIDVFLNKNIGCFYRYLKTSIDSSKIDVPNSGPSSTIPANKEISKISTIKTGCAIIQKNFNNSGNNKSYRIEILTMNDSSAELFYIFIADSNLEIYKYDLTKNENVWSLTSATPIKWSNKQETLTFQYQLKEMSPELSKPIIKQYSFIGSDQDNIRDLMFSSSLYTENKVIVEQSSKNQEIEWKVKLEGVWEKRDEYCKDKTNEEKDKQVQEWCYSDSFIDH